MSYQNRSLREIIEDNNTALTTSISNETTRATTAEQANATAIASEISRATAAEQANATAIAAEEARVNAILLNAPPLLDTFKEVVDAYEAADQSLTLITNNNTNNITANATAIAAEITRATAAESSNTTAITNETARATSSENTNATDIASETTRATTAETANTSAINAEIARATAAEGANTTNLNTEITRATTAEGLNTTNLNAEITRAIAAEGLNTTNLNSEITRATAAETLNATNISNQGTTITALQSQQNINTTTISGLFTQQGTNTTAIASNTTNISTNTTAIASNTTDIATNTTAIASNTTNIATNTTAIASNTTDIATNTTNIATNTTNIASNTTAIATKQDTITASTALTTGVLTATDATNDIDIRNNISAGSNITLTQNGNITSIASTGGAAGVNLPNPIIGAQQWYGATAAGGTNVIKLVNGQVPANSTRQVFEISAYTFIESSANGSKWNCDFDCDYEFAGNSSDTVKSRIYWRINGGAWQNQGHRQQKFDSGGGGGTRSGVIFPAHISKPLTLSYNAGDTIKFRVDVQTTGDDILYIRTGTNETKPTANFVEILENNINSVNASTNLTVASITATGATNDIDIRNNISAGSNITLTQTGTDTEIAVDPAPLAAEITRATAAEGVNATNIAAEITRATAAEGVNATNIAAEITRATAAEGVNATAIATNITDIATNTTNIAAEITRATAAEGANATNIASNITDIATNTTAIATNATAIATKQNTITGSTALTTGALTATAATNDIDLRNNITAGSNITLTQNGNITSIASSGGGAATSTQYYFKANGTANQSLSTGATNEVLNFNNVLFQSPSGYNITNKEYVVQVAGVYQFFYQIFFAFNNANAEVRLGLYLTRGGTTTTINQTGQYIYTAERLGLTYECLVGDKFSVRVVYNNSGGTISTVLGQSWFEGYLLQPVNNTVTSSTALTAATITAQGTTNDIDLRNNISAGSNITLTQNGNITEIASSGGGSTRSIFSATRSTNFFVSPNTTTDVRFPYDSTAIITDSNYSWTVLTPIGGGPDQGVLTFNTAGTYLVSATVNLFAQFYDNRVVGRLRPLTNNAWSVGDAQAFCYLRHDDYGDFESCTFSQYPMVFAVNDTLQIQVNLTKSNFTPWVSNFNGVAFAAGNNLTVEKVA